jgi:hypothetical protein
VTRPHDLSNAIEIANELLLMNGNVASLSAVDCIPQPIEGPYGRLQLLIEEHDRLRCDGRGRADAKVNFGPLRQNTRFIEGEPPILYDGLHAPASITFAVMQLATRLAS